jgi:hypothetical protein
MGTERASHDSGGGCATDDRETYTYHNMANQSVGICQTLLCESFTHTKESTRFPKESRVGNARASREKRVALAGHGECSGQSRVLRGRRPSVGKVERSRPCRVLLGTILGPRPNRERYYLLMSNLELALYNPPQYHPIEEP